MTKHITQLRIFFRTSNASFDFVRAVMSAFGHPSPPSYIESLHRLALVEIEKESPDMALIDQLLAQMESAAEENKNTKK